MSNEMFKRELLKKWEATNSFLERIAGALERANKKKWYKPKSEYP